ncbi:MAG: hypothetical protein AAF798_03940 [Bacteroidota bacterium]
MDYKQINGLLERYFEGQTSLEEEQQLQQYFAQAVIDERLQQFAPLFQFFEVEQTAALDEQFDARLLEAIEEQAKVVPMRSTGRRVILRWLSRAAAIVLIFAAAWWVYDTQQPLEQTGIDWSKYEVTDPQLAFALTQKALKGASAQIKKGSDMAQSEVKYISTMTEILK